VLGKGDNNDGKDKSDKGKGKGHSERLFLTPSFPLYLTDSQYHALARAMMMRVRMARLTTGIARRVMTRMVRATMRTTRRVMTRTARATMRMARSVTKKGNDEEEGDKEDSKGKSGMGNGGSK
jgi:hypothetical protein